jgi:hypothetical protein
MEPEWNNNYIPGLDAIALYSFLALKKPKKYFEVGSGNSSKFAKKLSKIFTYKLRSHLLTLIREQKLILFAIE